MKDVFTLGNMIQVWAHEIMDMQQKKVWMAIDVKATVINFHQKHQKLNDINFNQERKGRIQGLKTAK